MKEKAQKKAQRKPRLQGVRKSKKKSIKHRNSQEKKLSISRMKLLDLSRLDTISHRSRKKTKITPPLSMPTLPKTTRTNRHRLQKIISDAGICSRRKAEELILSGKVKVNGEKELKLGTKANPYEDIITVREKPIQAPDHKQKLYFLLNKPRGCVSTMQDPQGRTTVMDYLKEIPSRVFPVGRLDYASEGLLLFTNDGEMAHKLMHPSSQVKRSYAVKLRKRMHKKDMEKLEKGLNLREGFVQVLNVRRGKPLKEGEWVYLNLKEGRNLVVRRLFKLLGYETERLRRVAIGPIHIQRLPVGKFCQLRKKELLSILNEREKKVSKYSKKKLIPHKSYRGPGKS